MEITLTRNTARKGDRLIYTIEGRPGSVQFTSRRLFEKDAPQTLTLVGTFAAPPRKETPAERKARLAAITPAEKLAKMEKRIAAMRAKLATAPESAKAPVAAKVPPPAAPRGKK